MVLIEPSKFRNFDEYIKSLSRKARKNYAYVKKHNSDLTYEEIPFDYQLLSGWMRLWERQLIRGEYREWAFGTGYLEELEQEGKLICFWARKGEEVVSTHFVEDHEGYLECHPPMYEKEKYSERYLAKFMWFSLVEWAITHGIRFLDMGGGGEPDWREMIRNRANYPNPAYKWMYVPEYVKRNPDQQPRYTVESNGRNKWVREAH